MARILLMDDEPDNSGSDEEDIREREGYEAIVAKNSAECFEKLEEEMPDLILMDIMMPNDDGWETCRKIKGGEKTRDSPLPCEGFPRPPCA
jgi:CheY-like chemotaxis protein